MKKEKQQTLWSLINTPRRMGMDFDYDLFTALMKARRYSARYHVLCTQECNGEGIFSTRNIPDSMTIAEFEERSEKAYSDIEKRIQTVFDSVAEKQHFASMTYEKKARSFDYRIDFQRDPRGWEIKICAEIEGQEFNISEWLYFKF